MNENIYFIFSVLSMLLAFVTGIEIPSLPDASNCLGGVTDFKTCNVFFSKLEECAGSTSNAQAGGCMCTQEFMNNLRECQNELRTCDQTEAYDSNFDSIMNIWHTACDSQVDFKVTTPALTPLAQTFNADNCETYATICESAVYESQKCSSSATASINFLSCVCDPELTSIYSRCQYDGNVSCALERGRTEDILGFSVCPYFQKGEPSAPAEVVTSALEVFSWSSGGDVVGSPETTPDPGAVVSLPGVGPGLTKRPTVPAFTSTSPGSTAETGNADSGATLIGASWLPVSWAVIVAAACVYGLNPAL